MKTICGYLIMLAGVWAMAWVINWLQTPTPHDGWLFFPVLITFFAIECAGATLAELWDYI